MTDLYTRIAEECHVSRDWAKEAVLTVSYGGWNEFEDRWLRDIIVNALNPGRTPR